MLTKSKIQKKKKMNLNLIFIGSIILASLVEYGGDASFKLYNKYNSNWWLLSGILFYLILIAFIIMILKYANVMHMNISWDAVSVVLETILAFILLGETLSGYFQYFGFFFIVLGLIFMNIEGKSYK